MLATGTVLDIGDHSVKVVANPEMLGDRYLLRIEAGPGGPRYQRRLPSRPPNPCGDLQVRIREHGCQSGSNH